MKFSSIAKILLFAVILSAACTKPAIDEPGSVFYSALKDVPAVRLNYRYEADVPAPDPAANASANQALNPAIQADFDQNRIGEMLDRTIASPDGKRALAIYHRPGDLQDEYRLDMYLPDGTPMQKITADTMAVHFQETIVWSPDSANVAFVAMLRDFQSAGDILPEPAPGTDPEPTPDLGVNTNNADINSNQVNGETAEPAEPVAAPTPAAPTGILTFRTEQIYICNADGLETKPLTQNEGLIYFYYVWSPDSSMLAALAATGREWQFLKFRADEADAIFIPSGRPRIVEKNGRERRLDDGLTNVQPVWSPDSAKVAAAFDKQIRIYDSTGVTPTQAAVPLRNALLLSSSAFDKEQDQKLAGSEPAPANANTAAPINQEATMLPDENTLVSFNPIVALTWQAEDLLYFQTAYVKRMKNEADSATSFPRWHRLILTPQPPAN